MDELGNVIVRERAKIPMTGRSSGENWRMLDRLIERDTVLTEDQKAEYADLESVKDIDLRERRMQGKAGTVMSGSTSTPA